MGVPCRVGLRFGYGETPTDAQQGRAGRTEGWQANVSVNARETRQNRQDYNLNLRLVSAVGRF